MNNNIFGENSFKREETERALRTFHNFRATKSGDGLSPPTGPFTIQEPQEQEIGEAYVIQECRATDFEVVQSSVGLDNPTNHFTIFEL